MRHGWLSLGFLPVLLAVSAVILWGEPASAEDVREGVLLVAQADGAVKPGDILVDKVEFYVVWEKGEGRSYGLINVSGVVTNVASEPAVKITLNAQLLNQREEVLAETSGTVIALAPGDTRPFLIRVVDYEGAAKHPPFVRVLVEKVE